MNFFPKSKTVLLVLTVSVVMINALVFVGTFNRALAQNAPATATTADDPTGKGGLVQCGNKIDDPCTVEDIFNIFVIATNLMVGVVGLVTIYGIFSAGWSMTMSAGNTERVSAAKKQLTNAIIGLLLVLLAFLLINVVVYALLGAKGTNIISNPLDYIGLTPGANPAANTPSNTPPANGP